MESTALSAGDVHRFAGSNLRRIHSEPAGGIPKDVSGIHNSGRKAENLVKQLLGFSRRQLMTPQVVNLNDVVSELNSMLSRLISEDIGVIIELEEKLKYVFAPLMWKLSY